MGVYIKGMEMPKEGCIEILIHSDGIVQLTGRSVRIEGVDYYTPYIGEKPEMHTAIPVPPHGRLVDADRILSEQMKRKYYHLPNGDTAIPIIDVEHAPTIIEAEE